MHTNIAQQSTNEASYIISLCEPKNKQTHEYTECERQTMARVIKIESFCALIVREREQVLAHTQTQIQMWSEFWLHDCVARW